MNAEIEALREALAEDGLACTFGRTERRNAAIEAARRVVEAYDRRMAVLDANAKAADHVRAAIRSAGARVRERRAG